MSFFFNYTTVTKKTTPNLATDKKKILFLGEYSYSKILGGPYKVAKRIYGLSFIDFNCEFWEYFQDGNEYGLVKKIFGFEIVNNDFRIYKFGVFPMIKQVFKLKPDVVHIMILRRYTIILFLLKYFLNFKVAYNVHGIIREENKNNKLNSRFTSLKDKYIENIIVKHSDYLLYLSGLHRKTICDTFNIKSDRLLKIANGVDDEFSWHEYKKDFFGILSAVFIGNTGWKEKGFDFILHSLEEINFSMNLFVIHNGKEIAGDFKSKNEKLKIIKIERMETDELARFFEDKHIILSGSMFDSFNIAVAEAMAAGLVPLVTEETGISEYIVEGENGYIYKYGDKVKLLSLLNTINSDRKKMELVSRNTKNIINILNWNKIYNRYYKIMYELS